MPSDWRPASVDVTTPKAACAHAPTSGRNDGTVATAASAPSRSSGTKAPRLAASIAPGPPPVATVRRAPSPWPRRAASAYARLPRSSACPPMTPTTSRPDTHPVSAASMLWSCSARARVSSGAVPPRDQAYALASRVAS